MKTKSKRFVLLGFGGLLLLILLMSFANYSSVSNCINTSEPENGVLKSKTLAATCETEKYTFPDDVNSGVDAIIDDRTCAYNYIQTKNETDFSWGSYRLKAGTSSDVHHPRMERASKVVKKINSGNYVRIDGVCRIKRVGILKNRNLPNTVADKDGTYFIQAKGTHYAEPGKKLLGSSDPAICLFLAKPHYEKDGITYNSFDIYREEIKYRGGEGDKGRNVIYITNVGKNKDFNVSVVTGFNRTDPNSPIVHYVNAEINGVTANFIVPSPERAKEAKLRMGAYRCLGGEAEILWRSGVSSSIIDN